MRCGVLFTGGLDGQLAVRLLQAQQIDVTAICFRSAFGDTTATAKAAADALRVPLAVVDLMPSYPERLRQPRLGFVAGAAPCLDCRVAMLAKAHYLLAELGAELLATGDVVGQRVRSAIRDFEVVDYHAGLEGRVLRPLSARLLSETHAEQQGWVDREQLLDWQGKSRRLQERLAERLGVPLVPPRPDCPLLTGSLAKRALSLLRSPLPLTAWELELLPIGRHVWLDHAAYVVIGRNEEQNERLASAATDPVALPTIRITPVNFPGPTALLIGRVSEGSVQRVCELVTRYSRHVPPEQRLRIEFLLNRAKSP